MKENFVDFKQVKELAAIETVLNRYRVELRRVNQHALRGRCPLPMHTSKESKESFCVDVPKKIWSCQSSTCVAARSGKKGGNVLDFVALMENCSIREAALKLSEWFANPEAMNHAAPKKIEAPGVDQKPKLVAEKKEGSGDDDRLSDEENRPLPFTLKDIDPDHAYLRHRGIKKETAEHFGVGFFPGKGSMLGRVVIPIHNQNGELIAYAGRAIDATEPKYKLPAGFKKSAVLFNLNRVLACKQESNHVIVVEGFFDCMKVHQAGFTNVVALMGSTLSEIQEKLLFNFTHAVLFLDGDAAGREAAESIALRLVPHMFVRVISLPDGEQPDGLSSEEIKTILSS